MKKVLVNMVIVIMINIVSLSAHAQSAYSIDYQFQSTSTLQGSGSAYSSVAVTGWATTTYDAAPAPVARAGARKSRPDDWADPAPIGDGWVMLVLAAVGGGVLVLRRRKRG